MVVNCLVFLAISLDEGGRITRMLELRGNLSCVETGSRIGKRVRK